MAEYSVKYRFRWNDEGGGDWRIDICQAGYTGDILPRAIGASSVSLRRDRNGNICGTSLELTAECRVDEEFAELYTTDPFEFKVMVYAESVCIWTGYVTPELYSEPFIAPPYDVKVTASDNLGELKLTEWVGVGRLTFAQLLNTLLAQTGLSMGVKYISTLATGSISAQAFFSTVTIDLDELSGKSYYDVLDQLLASFHAVLFQHGGSWVVLRETDVVPSISGGAVVPVGQSAGMPIRSLGSAYAGGLWPENHVDLTVEPAKKAISLICPELWNRYGTASITNPSTGNATGTLTATFAAADGINLNDSSTTSRYPLALNIEALRKNRSNKVYYDIVVKVQGNGVTRYLVENTDAAEGYAWQSSSASIKITPGDKLYYAGRGDVSASKSGEVTSIPFPDCNDITALTKIEVTLTSNTIATSYRPTRYLPSVYFFGAWISYDDQFTSLMDTIAINNNARGAASDVNLIVSGLTDTALEKYFISNSLLDGSGSLLGAVHTSAFEGQDYISLLSRDYALSIAAPRLKAEGVFYGQERTDLPLFMSMGGLRYVIETWDWNLITGGVDFSALTLPAATITVTSETIVTGDNLGHGSSSGSGGSGGSSSSGAGYVAPGTGVPALTEAYIGTTRVQPSPTEDQDLTGIGNATLSGKLNLPQGAYLEVVNVGTTANPVYAIHTNIGLYSDSFISAFGASDTGGGGGGGLITRVYGTSGFGGTYSDTDYTNTFNAFAINRLHERITALEGASVDISINVTGSGNAVTNGSYNNGVITLTKGATFLTSVAFADLTAHPTTLAGYGITDAKIQNGVITLGGNTITPMTSIGAGSVTNAMLANSAITINGTSTSLGGSFSTASITAGTAGTSSATSGLSIAIPYVTLNQYGIVTAYGTHTHSISKANITSAIGSTTYAPYNSAGYLPLSGGTMTGDIKMTYGKYLTTADGATIIGVTEQGVFYIGDPQAGWNTNIAGAGDLLHDTGGSLAVILDQENFDTYALPLAGGVMTGPISGVTYLSVNRAAQTTYRLDVNGATRLAGNTSVTGTLGVTGATTLANLTVGSSNSITLGEGVLTWDATNSAWKLTGNLYATGFVSAFGASDTGGGGGGGIDLSAMWANLQVNESGTTGYNLQINPGHLTTALGTYVNAITTTGSGNAITAVSKSGSTLTFTKGSTFLTSHQSLANYVTLNSAQTITALKTSRFNSQVLLGLTRTGGNYAAIEFAGTVSSVEDTALGRIGYSPDGAWVRDASDTAYRYIWHTGNLTSSAITDILASGSIANGKLANSSITINGTSTSLGGTFNTASITAGTAGTSSATSGLSFAVPYVTLNAYGVATAYGTHTHTISASNITTAIGSTTYAPYNADGYLPLSGGAMANTNKVTNLNADLLDGLNSTDFTQKFSYTLGTSSSVDISFTNTTYHAIIIARNTNNIEPLILIGGGYGDTSIRNRFKQISTKSSPIHWRYHSGEGVQIINNGLSNATVSVLVTHGTAPTFTAATFDIETDFEDYALETVNGAASKYLPLSGGTMTGAIILSNATTLQGLDTGGTARSLIGISSDNDASLFYGTAGAGYDTYINGNNVYLRYGTGRTTGMTLTSDGDVTLTNTLCLNNNKTIRWEDTNGNLLQCLQFNSVNRFHVGYGAAVAGYDTYINGNNIYFRYGTTPTNGAILDSSGNVGIGTTSPANKLHVSGGGRFDSNANIWSTISGAQINFNKLSTYTTGYNQGIRFRIADSSNTEISSKYLLGVYSTSAYQYMYLGGTNTDAPVRITDTGVGIMKGNASPSYALDVAGVIHASSNVTAGGNITATGYISSASYVNSLGLKFPTNANRTRINATGWYRVWTGGARDTFPTSIILNITKNFGGSASEGYLIEIGLAGNGQVTFNQISGTTQTSSRNITKIRYVYVYNTAAPSTYIDIYYSGTAGNDVNISGLSGHGTFSAPTAVSDTTGYSTIEFETMRFAQKTSRNIVAMGTIRSTTGIYSDGYVSAFGQSTTSDARLKKDFRDTTLTVDAIAHAPAITFLWKDREGKRQAGSLAQYWETVLPEVVTDIEGKKGLDYGAAALVSAITIARDVNDHEKRIRELERENRELKRRLGYGI